MAEERLEPTRTLRSAPVGAVAIDDGFWGRRREVVREVVLDTQYERLDGRLENLRRAAGDAEGGFEGPYHNDPPVYKWLEAACYAAETVEGDVRRRLETRIREVVDLIEAAQAPDGYLHSYYLLEHPPEARWTNLHAAHELFALGHLIEAAVAHREATGSRRLLEVAIRFADHVDDRFGPDGVDGCPGHPEVELALVRLYRETGERRYLKLASYFVDERGRADSRFRWELDNEEEIAGGALHDRYADADGDYDGRYAQDHAPVREQSDAVGHAVKATFLYSGMADVALETGDDDLWAAVERLWRSVTERRSYVTGGIGARHEGEAFGDDYELPNDTAYAETCAAFAAVEWNRRLVNATGDRRPADALERTLYNGFLVGASLEGTRFSYTNPLAHDGDGHHRRDWFDTVCCPPNYARLLTSLERYVYSLGDDAIYATLFVGSELTADLEAGRVGLEQTTEYPWDGTVTLGVSVDRPTAFDLAVRIPGWARDPSLSVDGEPVDLANVVRDGYAHLERTWRGGEEVTLELPVPVARAVAHPEVDADRGLVALRRGPLVYCFEGVDNEFPVGWLSLPDELAAGVDFEPDLLGGVAVVETDALAPDPEGWEGELYRRRRDVEPRSGRARAVPYYAWDNREPTPMRVWVEDGG